VGRFSQCWATTTTITSSSPPPPATPRDTTLPWPVAVIVCEERENASVRETLSNDLQPVANISISTCVFSQPWCVRRNTGAFAFAGAVWSERSFLPVQARSPRCRPACCCRAVVITLLHPHYLAAARLSALHSVAPVGEKFHHLRNFRLLFRTPSHSPFDTSASPDPRFLDELFT